MCDAIWAGGIRCEGDSDTAYYTAVGAIALNKNDKDILAEAIITMISSARREDNEFMAMQRTVRENTKLDNETLESITTEARIFRRMQRELAEMGKERPSREVEEEMKMAYKTAYSDMETRVAKLAGSTAPAKARERKYDSVRKNARRYSIVKEFKHLTENGGSVTEKILLTDRVRKEYGDDAAAKAYYDLTEGATKEEAITYVASGELAKAVKQAKANQRSLNREIAKAASKGLPLEGKIQIAERVKQIYGTEEGARALSVVSAGEVTLEEAHAILQN